MNLADLSAPVIRTPGVLRLLGCGSHPTPVPDQEIESLQRIVATKHAVEPCALTVGCSVRLTRGPLIGLKGILSRVKNDFRLIVNVNLLQRAVSVEIDKSWAVLVEEDPNSALSIRSWDRELIAFEARDYETAPY
jgi:transcription antitermination factor NusG